MHSPSIPLFKVLVIDDSVLIRKAVVKILGDEFNVITAEDGLAGLEVLKKDKSVDLVITDLMMPRVHGFDVIKAIRASKREDLKRMSIIVITGNNADNTIKLKALDIGANDFIPKPFTAIDLLARVRVFFSHSQETQTLQEEKKTLEKQVVLDAVSGLMTKKSFDEQLEKDVSRVIRHQEDLAIMLLEIKNTKTMLGNDLIKIVTKVLLDSVRKEDTVARIGTSLFAISLPTTHFASAMAMAQRMCDAVSLVKAKVSGKRISLVVAVGVCAIEKECCPPADQLFKSAKETLLEAKLASGSKVAVRHFNERIAGQESYVESHYAKTDTVKNSDVVYLEKNKTDISKTEVVKSEVKNSGSKKTIEILSIDKLLHVLEKGDHDTAMLEMERAIDRLMPLLKLLTKEQKKKLLK